MNWILVNHLHELFHIAAATFFITKGASAIWDYRYLRSRFLVSYFAMCLFSAGYCVYVVISHNLSDFGEFWIPWTTAGLVVTFSATFLYLFTVGRFLAIRSRLFVIPLILLAIITIIALGDLLLYAVVRRSLFFIPVPRKGIGLHQLALGEGAYSLQVLAEILPVIFIISIVLGVGYLLVHLIRIRSNDIFIYIGLSMTAAIIVNESLVALSVYEGVYLLAFTKAFETQRIYRDIKLRSLVQIERSLRLAEKRELEKRIQIRTAKLEAANKELDAFAYSVSHDLRAPLRHITGYIDLLGEKAGAALDEKSLHYMDSISDSAKKMAQLIDDLLSFSRMGRQEMSKKPVDLSKIVHDVKRELESDFPDREIEWRIGDLPLITVDSSMLRVVMTNLLSNAIKFTSLRERGIIEIGCQLNEEEIIVLVSDNGVGFDPPYTEKLFGVFQRLHHAEEFEGTGVGLAIAQRIIHRHGGRIWAEGKLNKGATFYFSLPHFNEGEP
jgi:signal transduction histidine kinase